MTPTHQPFRFLISIAIFCWVGSYVSQTQAQNVESYGIYGGLNFPFTIDEGLRKDPRFYGQFTLRASPFGFCYGYDKVGHGFVVTPGFFQIGQKFIIKNTIGGEVGSRDVRMNYISLPVAFKLHINDMAFFRLSLVASVHANFLISGKELITHSASKLRYPSGVAVPTDPGYAEVYDGVFVPDVTDLEYVSKDKYKPIQLFAGLGLRSDFDINEDWSINFDGRANASVFDPRKAEYINQLKAADNAPDLYGKRREVYLSVAIGISRIIQIKDSFQGKRSSKLKPHESGKPRNKKPKG